MATSIKIPNPRAEHVEITDDELIVRLADGRKVSAPLVWFPRLLDATVPQRRHWELMGDGDGIHWPDLDEDLSVQGLLRGTPAPGGSTDANAAS